MAGNGIPQGGIRTEQPAIADGQAAGDAGVAPTKKKPKRLKATPPIDPRLTAMSRELRDQWAERAGAIVPQALGKHDVKRIAHATAVPPTIEARRLEQAA